MLADVYADDVNYWKTSAADPDSWMTKARREIIAAGGTVDGEAFGSQEGRAAFRLDFSFGRDHFRVIWPVLQPRSQKDLRAARVQAATMLYHDVKAKCVSAKVHGMRAAFFQYAVLPDGRTAAQVAEPDLIDMYPKLLTSGV
jgi:hypothetical protein